VITISHLRKEYSNATPLSDVNAEINKGDVICIIGPSGTGKSTFLRMLNQLEKPTSGDVYLDGECITAPGYDITKARQRMAMVFQSFNLYETLCIAENIMVGPIQLKGMGRQEAYDQAMELLRRVGLEDKALNYPDELSGGQKQRVAIARAIAMQPEIMLLDEPTSALDPRMVSEVQNVIRDLANEGMTMMIVTHEMDFARTVSNRIFYMDEGVIYEQGTPEEIFGHPQRPKTQAFVRQMNMLDLTFTIGDMNVEEMLSTVLDFARNNHLSRKGNYQLNLLFEELVIGTIAQNLSLSDEVSVIAEFNASTNMLQLDISYGGKQFNPLNEADELSTMLVRNIASVRFHSYEDGINHIRMEATLG